MDGETLTPFLDDERVLDRIKVENYLLVHLGLRPASQATLPAELPGGMEMGARIDMQMQPVVERLREVTDPRAKLEAIKAVKQRMGDLFERVVEGSSEYEAHYRWARDLGLRVNQVKVRPTVHELYLYKERSVGREIRKLMMERGRLRGKARRKPSPERGRLQFAYPEEFDARWLRRMGEVLGYPDCCVDRYAGDRGQGVNVEARAAQQLTDSLSQGEVDPHTYIAGFFFPCRPDCEKALGLGRRLHRGLEEADARLGEMYSGMIADNMERVARQPEIIANYLSRAGMRSVR